ncbi:MULTISPECIES: glutamyl-tRNA reductase [Nocardiopsis]|uniref:Glutamyl-tRNA reductase n=1 Tax=Nocardiopsis lambiniae TaxID=3075539 RepID=A0ABU2M8A3_9ACTN|nr:MULTISPECIES: glutamyl-tRNA reductase [unclassified Nocardiopsis]MDE3724721.1 glutamyl-tRNA reductase [Nocardiopsis sp. N85]MDT0328206.1 glutamyl-tRNA reductase [Nocardiopsis sp. DSM 44743]
MSVLAVGLSHRSSPVALLERVALNGETRAKAVEEMVGAESVNEVMVVSTCNRTEIYADVDAFHGGVSAITELLSWHTGVPLGELSEHMYVHYEERAVQHLFSVTCGLDSMVLGEGQILGQVRDALKSGQETGSVGRVLNDLGQRALRVGKRAHTETHLDHAGADMVSFGLTVALRHLGLGPTGGNELTADRTVQTIGATPPVGCPMSAAAGDTHHAPGLARATAGPLEGMRVLILGAGSMSALSANTVARQGAATVIVANRTRERADRLAECLTEAYEGVAARSVPFSDAAATLPAVDLVISCTGAQGLVLTADAVAAATADRTRPLVFLDLALPHDIDLAVRDLPAVRLVDIEDLRQAATLGGGTGTGRGGVLELVRDIVDEEVAEFRSVRRAAQVAPTVVALRAQARGVVEAELSRLHGRLPEDLDDRTREEITRAMRRVADKLLHRPTVRVKELAAAPDGESYEAALRELFDLDDTTITAVRPAQEKA